MSNDLSGKKDQPRDDSAKEEKKLEQSREDNIPKSGVLTNTPGSPRVPSPEEMAASPDADGKDNRIDLDKQQSQKDRDQATTSKENKNG